MLMDPLAPIRLTTAYFILFCIALHSYTGFNLALFPEAAGSTTVSTPVELFGGVGMAAAFFLFAAASASFAMQSPFPWNVILLLPQQAVLIMASVGIVEAIWQGHFADGVVRPRAFIAQDHCEIPLICAFHAGVLIMRASLTSRLGPGMFFHPVEKSGC